MKANLKKLTSTLALVLFVSLTTFAQRIAIVDVNKILEHIEALGNRHQMAIEAKKWSQQYTLDAFESEIEGFLK